MDATSIAARLNVIVDRVEALEQKQHLSFDELTGDHDRFAAVEHDFQIAIRAALDIGTLILSDLSIVVLGGYRDIFPKLAELGILPADFAQKLVG